MKRWMGFIVAIGFAGAALAQAPFTIVRPADGAKVREVVKVQVPKGSLGEGDFVGIYIDGKFVEATLLEEKGDFKEYLLDTKASKIADGQHELKLVKFKSGGDTARIEDKSSVNVTVANSASIKVPEDGFLLRYKWVRGKQLMYNTEVRGTINAISESGARSGGRSAELPLETDNFRYLYSVENAYPNGNGLIRMQALPPAGKDSVFFKLLMGSSGDLAQGKKYTLDDMYPVYMIVNDSGYEQYGGVPLYVPMFGSAGADVQTDLFCVLPMPILPTKAIKPGEPFPSRFQMGSLDLSTIFETKSLVDSMPARGEFVGAEWESGHPCAKLRYTMQLTARKAKAGTESKEGLGSDKIGMEQVVYFAMDLGVPVKMDLDLTIDTKGAISTGGEAGGGGAPSGGGGGLPGSLGMPGGGKKGGGGGGAPASVGGFSNRPGTENSRQMKGGQGGRQGPPGGNIPRGPGVPAGMGPGGPQGPGSGMGRQGGPAGGGMAQNQYLRLRIKFTQTLVQ